MSLVLHVDRTIKDEQATYSDCKLLKNGVVIYRKNGIENTKFLMAAGEYEATVTRSPRFSKQAGKDVFTWEIQGVFEGTRLRVGLRVHPVNFARDLLGCLAFGMELRDLNDDDVIDLARSREAHRIFDQACGDAKHMMVVITDP